jgi:RNA polymerase sigma-70 factor (ECF subfamily)
MRHACRTPEAPGAWLAAIAHNEGRRHVARRVPEPVADVAEPAAGADAVKPLAERLDLRRALRVLDPVDQRLLTLRYVGDRSSGDIARLADMPASTVRVRLHRARARIRAVI